MPKPTCEKQDCTAAATGKCILGKKPAECQHFRPEAADSGTGTTGMPKVSPENGRRFHPGLELGAEDAYAIMRERYCHLIGILGVTDAGKTCLLSSMYLMACHGELMPKYSFAGSLTLQGFEDRARRLRSWKNGALPKRLSEHTSLADPRQPSLVHLALREDGFHGRRIDLLLTDLPGEWTAELIARAETSDRFKFLKRADSIFLVIEGTKLETPETRHVEVHRAELVIRRLKETLNIDPSVPLLIVVSKADEMKDRNPTAISEIEVICKKLGFSPTVVLAAAFSKKPGEIPNGQGIQTLIETTLSANPRGDWKALTPLSASNRFFERFNT